MLGKLYKINDNETGFSYVLKREANIILNEIDKNNPTFHYKKEYFDNILNICKAIDEIKPESDDEMKDIIDTINKLYTTGLLSPLTLKDDEFKSTGSFNYQNNIRYPLILKNTKDNKIINNNAYKAKIYNIYDHNLGAKVFENEPDIYYNPVIFNNYSSSILLKYYDIIRCFIIQICLFIFQINCYGYYCSREKFFYPIKPILIIFIQFIRFIT